MSGVSYRDPTTMNAPVWRGAQAKVVSLPPGTVLALDGEDWLYGRGQQPGRRFTIVVNRVRTELTGCYEGQWVWIEGHAPDCGGNHEPCRQALVRADAIAPLPAARLAASSH